MNRKQFIAFAGKLHKMAYQLEQDAKRVNVSSHPYSEHADSVRSAAELLRRLALAIEAEFS